MSATDPIEVQLLANTDFESTSATTTIQSSQPQSTNRRSRRSRPRSSLVRSLLRNRKGWGDEQGTRQPEMSEDVHV